MKVDAFVYGVAVGIIATTLFIIISNWGASGVTC